MSNSRSKNALLNIVFGYAAQMGILILSFVGRRIFLRFLSIDYLGINGLYSNILTVLSLAELGLDTAVLYSLYKPVADNDIPLINSLLKYFKKIYTVLAVGIFAVGLALIPFLKFIVKSSLNDNSLIIFYLLFLVNTVASYFVAQGGISFGLPGAKNTKACNAFIQPYFAGIAYYSSFNMEKLLCLCFCNRCYNNYKQPYS